MLPLDLHVLGLPLAFILSQDQTLRCFNPVDFFFDFVTYVSFLKTLSFLLPNLSKNFCVVSINISINIIIYQLFSKSSHSFAGCKDTSFFYFCNLYRKKNQKL